MKDQAAMKQMGYNEFLVFIARLAYEVYKDDSLEIS
jgi:hypothetical protein